MSIESIRPYRLLAGFVLVLFPLTFCVGESKAQTLGLFAYSAKERAYIRSLPITERPNRPFHFYGNAVRRTADRIPPTEMRDHNLPNVTTQGKFVFTGTSRTRPAAR